MKNPDATQLAAGGALCQFFLTRPASIRRLVDSLGITVADDVLEIGGGRGTITRELLARGSHTLTTVELDSVLAASLRSDFATAPSVHVVCGDGFDAIERSRANLVISSLPIASTERTLSLVLSSTSILRCVMVADRTADKVSCPLGWEAEDVCDLTGSDFTPSQPVVSHVLRLTRA